MMLLSLLTVIVTVATPYSFTNTGVDIIYQTNRVVMFSNAAGETTQTPTYTVNYNWPFTHNPTICVSVVSINYQSPASGKILLPQNAANQLTLSYLQYAFSATNLYYFEIYYLAVDFTITDSIKFLTLTIDLNVGTTTTSSNMDTGGVIQNDDTFVVCFLSRVEGVSYPDDFLIYIECQELKTSTTINVTVSLPGGTDGTVVQHPSTQLKRMLVVGILIKNDGSLNVNYGALIASNSVKSATLVLNQQYPEDLMFIGLTCLYISTRNIYLGLTPNTLQIDLFAPFYYIQFRYILAQQLQNFPSSYIRLIGSNVFSIGIFFYYSMTNLTEVKLTQFSTNVTWLTNGALIQSSPDDLTYMALVTSTTPDLSDSVEVNFTYTIGWRIQNKTTVLNLIVALLQRVDVIERNITFELINAKAASQSTLSYTSSINLTGIYQNGNNATLYFTYNDTQPLGNTLLLSYYDSSSLDNAGISYIVPNVVSFQSSARNVSIEIRVSIFGPGLNYTSTQMVMHGSCVQNYTVARSGDFIVFDQDYISDESPLTNTFEVHYKSDPNIPTDYQMVFKLVTLLYVRTIVNSTTSQLVFTNIKNPERYTTSHLSFNISGIITQSVSYSSSNLVFTVSYDQSVNDTGFTVTAKEPTTSYSIIVDDTKIIERFVEFTATQYYNNLTITLKNVESLTSSSLPQISFNISSVILQSVKISDDNQNIIISVGYNASIADQQLDIFFESDTTTVYQDIVSLSLEYDFPLFYCAGTFEDKTELYRVYSSVLQYLYLIFCLYSAICCNKLIAVETLFLIQLVYYSMIPVGIYCPPFIGIEGMKYVSGVNPLFSTLSQEKINSNFYNFGFKSNFLSNINLMLLLGFICPFIYGVMALASKYSQSYKLKPRLLKYGKSFLLEVPLTILFFNSFNIYISFAIEIQFLGTSDALSLVLSIIAAMLLPGFTLMFFFLNKHFCEFKEEFDPVQRIGSISQQCSLRIRQVYPAVLVFEYITVPLFLSICSMFSTSLYAVIAVTTAVSVFILVSTPYIHKLDNIRLIIHRVIILAICGVCIGMKSMMNDYAPADNFVYSMPLVLLILLSIGIFVNGSWMVILSLRWFKKKGVINHEMKMKATSTMNKPAPINKNQGIYYPKLQYGQYRRENLINRKKKINMEQDNKDRNQQELLIQPTNFDTLFS